jgi:hypothetical protein
MSETENSQSIDSEEASEPRPREEDMKAAAAIVFEADDAASPVAAATEPGAGRNGGPSKDTGADRTPPLVEVDPFDYPMPPLVVVPWDEYSEALEQRFQQIMDKLQSVQQQQIEAFRRYDAQHSFFPPPSTDPSGLFPYPRNSLLRPDVPKPDPPAIQVLLEDVLEKLDPDGKILTNEDDSDLPQERLTRVHSLRRVLLGESSESSLDKKLPARNTLQVRSTSPQSRRTTDLQKGHGDESQHGRKLPPLNTSKETSTSDRSQRVVDTGDEESPKPPVREPVSTQSFPDESPMQIIKRAARRIHDTNSKTLTNGQDTWETRADAQVGAIPVKEIKLNIMAPPGPLGFTFADDTEPPTVSAIEKSSPIFGSLEVGDELLKVDDKEVWWMSSTEISTLLAHREDEYRELSIQRAVRVDAENRQVSRQNLRQMIGCHAAANSESNTETSRSETPEDARERYRAEVETLVRLLVPEEIDNVDIMMDWFNGREADLVSTLRTMQEKNMAQRVQSEEDESTSNSDKAPRRYSPPEGREADTRAASELIGREPPGTTPLQPYSIQRIDPRLSRSEPGAIRVGGVYPSEDDPTVEVGSSTASQEPISATVVAVTDPYPQLTEAVAVDMIQPQQQGGRSCRDRFGMFISCLFCLRTRPAYR